MTTAEEAYKLFWGRRSLQEPRPHHESPRYPKPKHKEEFWDEVQRITENLPTQNTRHGPAWKKQLHLQGGPFQSAGIMQPDTPISEREESSSMKYSVRSIEILAAEDTRHASTAPRDPAQKDTNLAAGSR